MPRSPKKPCREPGCPALTDGGRCQAHQRQVERERGSAASRGYGVQHRRWRAMVLARDPFCRDPYARHVALEPATVADHVVRLKAGGSWALENGQGLCESCHAIKRASEGRGG